MAVPQPAAVAPKLERASKHDAAFLPRRIHVTGDIDIHELAWDGEGELWVVNTRFCYLCTLDPDHSFTPRWRPHFVSALAPEDRCHLNGLAIVDGKPTYVTALGETDTAGGWRANKARGGILMDVDTNQILLRGLSMPHSPRWYRKLWVLESGEGTLAQVDPRVPPRPTKPDPCYTDSVPGEHLMANLTIALNEQLLRRARVKAVQEGTSVNALLRQKLEEYASAPEGEPAHVAATREFLSVARKARGRSRGRSLSREELNERR